MIDDLKKQAAPKAAELIEVVAEQNEKLDNITILLSRLCDLHEDHEGRSVLIMLLDEHKDRSKNDLLWRKKWDRTKLTSMSIGAIATILTGAAFYFNVIKLDEESAFISGMVSFFKVISGVM